MVFGPIKVKFTKYKKGRHGIIDLYFKQMDIGGFFHPSFKFELAYRMHSEAQVDELIKKKGKILEIYIKD